MMRALSINSIIEYLESKNEKYHFEGDKNLSAEGFSSLKHYKEGSITWVGTEKLLKNISFDKEIFLAVVQDGVNTNKLKIKNKIITQESKHIFFDILEHFYGTIEKCEPIGRGTYLSQEVKLGKNVVIGHNCTLDGDITIGDNTRIYNNVVIINRAFIGKNCEIQSGVTIGHDGFGYTEDENHIKTMVKHHGGTEIGDNVYIGGNCYIERGTLDNTVIEDGVKIDGLCLIGHNSIIKRNSALVAGSILFGSVTMEENSYIASGLIKNQTQIGKNAFVGMGSVVTKDVEANTVVVGIPAKKLKER